MSSHLNNQASVDKQVAFASFITMGLTCERQELYRRINRRTEELFDLGLEEEVRGLLTRGYDGGLKSMQSIGYRHMLHYIDGDWTMLQCRERLARDTRRYAKRQYTWFNQDASIYWFDRNDTDGLLSFAGQALIQK